LDGAPEIRGVGNYTTEGRKHPNYMDTKAHDKTLSSNLIERLFAGLNESTFIITAPNHVTT